MIKQISVSLFVILVSTTSVFAFETPQEKYKSCVKELLGSLKQTMNNADCETVLLEDGSEQDDLWGANWYPLEDRIAFESLINIRPRLGNRSILIQSQELRTAVESVTREIVGGVR